MCTPGYRLSACSRHGQSVEEYRKNGIEITVYLYCDSLVENSTRTGSTGTAVGLNLGLGLGLSLGLGLNLMRYKLDALLLSMRYICTMRYLAYMWTTRSGVR